MTVNFSAGTTTLARPAATRVAEADAKKLSRYVKGEAIKDAAPDTFTGNAKSNVAAAAVFEGIPLLKFVKNMKKCGAKTAGEITAKTDKLMAATKKSLKGIFKGEGKLSTRIGKYFDSANELRAGYAEAKGAAKAAAKTEKLAKAGKATAEVATEVAVKDAGKEVAKKTAEVAGKAGKLGKFGKLMKSTGAGFMLVINGVMEAVTEVIPTFKKLGPEKGMKQLGKSAIRAVGDAAGWIAGEQIGAAAGAAIGTAICPVVGTAIGGAIGAIGGFLGGCTGSFLAGKLTKKLTGKTEMEKYKEEQENKAAQEIANDNNAQSALINAANTKLQAELQSTGTLSKDSQEIASLISSLPKQDAYTTPVLKQAPVQQPVLTNPNQWSTADGRLVFDKNPFTAMA